MNTHTQNFANRQQQYNLFALSRGTAHAGWSSEREDELGKALDAAKKNKDV